MVVVADRENHVTRQADSPHSARRSGLDAKQRASCRLFRFGSHRQHLFFVNDLQIEGVDDLAVILERFGASRLVERRDEGQTANLEQLWCRKEHHLRRK